MTQTALPTVNRQYALEYSVDGQHWFVVNEKRTYSDCPGTGIRNVPVTRSGLAEIQREAEFHSHRFPHIRIIHPTVGEPAQ